MYVGTTDLHDNYQLQSYIYTHTHTPKWHLVTFIRVSFVLTIYPDVRVGFVFIVVRYVQVRGYLKHRNAYETQLPMTNPLTPGMSTQKVPPTLSPPFQNLKHQDSAPKPCQPPPPHLMHLHAGRAVQTSQILEDRVFHVRQIVARVQVVLPPTQRAGQQTLRAKTRHQKPEMNECGAHKGGEVGDLEVVVGSEVLIVIIQRNLCHPPPTHVVSHLPSLPPCCARCRPTIAHRRVHQHPRLVGPAPRHVLLRVPPPPSPA